MLFEDMRLLNDEDRDLPIRWNVMHMYSSSQLAKIIALKRGMNIEVAGIAAALHDIAVIVTKKTENHAELAEQYVAEAIENYNNGPWAKLPKITTEEKITIVNAITKHSQKDIYSDDPFVELLKDVDSLDRYLHGVKTEGAYLKRSLKVLNELGISSI